MADVTEANIHIRVLMDTSADDQFGYEESFTVFLGGPSDRADVLAQFVAEVGLFRSSLQGIGKRAALRGAESRGP